MPNAPHRRPLSLRSAASRLAKGFTLIELLVVIAVIALLISILLPALKGARVAAWKAISAGNVRSICQAGAAYQHDNKGSLPIVPTGVPVPQNITAWITWGGWGKCASMAWRPPRAPSPVFDIAPDSRPLNPYFTQERVPSMQEMILDGTIRKTFQMNMFRDPGDRRGHQQTWNAFDPTYGIANPNADGSTCYDDVGTSYLLQAKWFSQTELYVGGNWTKAWRLGAERLRVSDGYFSSRMVWVNDENTHHHQPASQ